MKKGLISIIIPAYNESRNIGKVISPLLHMKKRYPLEIIVVDDGSSDKTFETAKKLKADFVYKMKKNVGKGGAFIFGIEKSKGEYVIQIDADNQFQVFDIPKFIRQLKLGSDIVCGSRFKNGIIETGSVSFKNYFGNWLMSQSTVFFSGIKITDIMAGYKGFSRNALEKLNLETTHFGYEAEVVVKAGKLGLSVVEVPITYKKRVHGHSSVSTIKDGFRVMFTIAKMYFTFPGQHFGKGVVGKRVLSFLFPAWFVILLPLLSFISIKEIFINEIFLLQLTTSYLALILITGISGSKLAGIISSTLIASTPLFSDVIFIVLSPTNNVFVYLTFFSLLIVLTFVQSLSNSRFHIKPDLAISITMMGLAALLASSLIKSDINYSVLILIAIFTVSGHFQRKSEPFIALALGVSCIILGFSIISGSTILENLGFASGFGTLCAGFVLEAISFKKNFSPLFSPSRLFKISLVIITLILVFQVLT